MISRRELFGVSLSALAFGIPIGPIKAAIGLRGGGTGTSFNGGLTQVNTPAIQNSGDYPFINLMKASQQWSYNNSPTDPTAPNIPIIELDANGYITSVVAGTNGVNTVYQSPTQSERSGNYSIACTGTGTITLNGASLISGALSGTNFTAVVNNGSNSAWGFSITAVNAAPNHISNISVVHASDLTAFAAGQVFGILNLSMMRAIRPGVIRSLGWGGAFAGTNESMLATWEQRTPRSYVTYANAYRNPAWYGGTTTNSGSDFTLAFSTFSLIDKSVVYVNFNTTSPSANGRISTTSSTTSSSPITVNWPSHGLAAGNTVAFGSTLPAPLVSGTTYFVKTVVDANNFTVAATSGGTAINATASTSYSYFGVSIPRININGSGFIPITPEGIPTPNNVFVGNNGPQQGVNTVAYDQSLGWYWLNPANTNSGDFIVGAPPEVFIDYCAQIGAQPHLVAPFLSVEQAALGGFPTDFMTSWAAYATNTYKWMKPRVEPVNECWSGGTAPGPQYAKNLGFVLWGLQGDADNAYGKWCSTLGQAFNTQYGSRAKYSLICAVQTTNFYSSSAVNVARRDATEYVSVNGGAPAYQYIDRVCGANYFSPSERFTCQELIDAYAYSVTYAGNPTQQAIIANNYVATSIGSNAPFTLAYVLQCFANIKAWGQEAGSGNTIAGITAYEGGYSPNYLTGNWTTGITAASQASSCVLTLASTSSNPDAANDGFTLTGNPAVVGMQIMPSGIVGMTQLNPFTATFTNSSPSIAGTNSFVAGQVVYLSSTQSLPTNFSPNTPYYVITTGLSGSAFQLSATSGGSAITAGSAGSGVQTCMPAFTITNVAGNQVTINVNSTAFTPYSSGGTATYVNSETYSNTLRQAGVSSTELGTINTAMYIDPSVGFTTLASSGFVAEYPSNFLYSGTGNIWYVLNPDFYASLTAQWNSIATYNLTGL